MPHTNILPLEFTAHRPSPIPPPMPYISAHVASERLPSFSCIAAVADAASQIETASHASPSIYSIPPAQSIPATSTTQAFSNYSQNVCTSSSYLPPPRSPSLSGAYRHPLCPADFPASPQVPGEFSSQRCYNPHPAPPYFHRLQTPIADQSAHGDELGSRIPSNGYGCRY